MQFSIKGGKTDDGSIDMCRSCSHAHIYTDTHGDHKICTNAGSLLPIWGQVSRCNDYQLLGHSTWEFEKIAWILETKKGKPVGFRPPKKEKDD